MVVKQLVFIVTAAVYFYFDIIKGRPEAWGMEMFYFPQTTIMTLFLSLLCILQKNICI